MTNHDPHLLGQVDLTHQTFLNCKEAYRHCQRRQHDVQKTLQRSRQEWEGILGQIELLGKGIEVLKAALVPLTKRGLGYMTELMTYGLNTIFHDREYAVDIEVKERGNDKTAVFWLIENPESDEPLRTSLRDSVGGGIQTVVSVILRIFFILYYRQRRFLVLDEPFGDINDRYLEGLFQFLRYTIQDLGFEILMITHDPRFKPFGDRVYTVTKGTMRETGDKTSENA